MIKIREEQLQDIEPIRGVNRQAFGQTQEADIVDKLRQHCDDLLSLVAIRESEVVGHILFSPLALESKERTVRAMGLGPMAVLPAYQRQGVGLELVKAGITRLASRQCPFIVVLGHPDYYPRFGFEPASRHGIRCEWEVPDNAFMVLVLDETQMEGVRGVARYRPEFAEA